MAKPISSASVGSVVNRLTLLCLLCLGGVGFWQSDGQEAPQTPHQKALREVAIAEALGREVQQLRSHPDYREAISRDADVEAVFERAQRVLRTAKSGLTRAAQTQSATGFSDSGLLARRATGTFEQYEARLRELFAEIEAERAPPPPPPPPPSPPTPPPPPPPPPPVEVEQIRTEQTTEVTPSADPTGDSDSAGPLPAPQVAPPPPPPPRRPSQAPPAKLRQAADAYFAGDYDAAIRQLSETSFRQRRSRAHALLLRAAARYALFLLGSETDYALRGQATEDITACKTLAPDLTPDQDVFSPRFRDFFSAAR